MIASRAWVLVLLVLAPGCDGGAGGGGGREERYRAFGVKFGEHVKAGDAAAAYQMTSTRYRAGRTAEAFAAFLKEAETKYGRASHVGVGINTVEADGPLGEGLGFPKEFPARDRRARLVVRMAKGPDAINDCLYEVWINVAEEQGEDRIVTVEIPGLNM